MTAAAPSPGRAPGFVKNPGKKLEVAPGSRRVRVEFAGQTIADTTRALLMREDGHPPVHYFPMADVRMDLMTPTAHGSHCPYKGDASYWTVRVGERKAENAVWSYRNPYDEMAAIRDYVAFYRDRIDALREDETPA